jgi:hypothetical protein
MKQLEVKLSAIKLQRADHLTKTNTIVAMELVRIYPVTYMTVIHINKHHIFYFFVIINKNQKIVN